MKHDFLLVGKGFLLASILLVGSSYVSATWADPTSPPPGDNPEAPINIGNAPQTKSGSLTSSDFLSAPNLLGIEVDASSKITAPEFCIGVSCLTAWPSTPAHRGALVYRNTTQSIPDNTATALSWNSEEYDTDSIHDNVTNPTRLTVPSGVSKVKFSMCAYFAANATGRRMVYMTKNGAAFPGEPQQSFPAPATGPGVSCVDSPVVIVTPGDYFEANVIQSSGAPLNAGIAGSTGSQHWFSMEVVE